MNSQVSYPNQGSRVTVRSPKRSDLPGILRVEWKAFPGAYECRFTPKSLLEWFVYRPYLLRVAKDVTGNVLGYSNVIPLSENGFNRLRQGCWHGAIDIATADIADGSDDQPIAYPIDVVASLEPDDVYVGSLLMRNMVKRVDPNARWFSACAATSDRRQ